MNNKGECIDMDLVGKKAFANHTVFSYVGKVKDAFFPLVDKLIEQPKSAEFIQGFKNAAMYSKQFTNDK